MPETFARKWGPGLLAWLALASAAVWAEDAPEAAPADEDTLRIENRSQGVTGILLDNVRDYLGLEEQPPPPPIYVEVQLEGVEGPLLDNVRAYLGLEKQKSSPQLSPTRIKRLYRQAPEEIRKALQAFGYYRAQVQEELHEPVSERQPWRARFVIDPGPPLPVAEMRLEIRGEGRDDSAFLDLRAAFPLKQGAPLEHAAYEKGKAELLKLADERGYFEARLIKNVVQVDLDSYTARAEVVFDSGPRYRFGSVSFEQQDFSEGFLRTFLTFEPGGFYSTEDFLAFRNALGESDYFEDIDLQTQRVSAGDVRQVNIVVRLQPRRKSIYRVRAGYGTDTELRGGVEWQRNVNHFGHRLEARLGVTQNKNKYVGSLSYQIPVGKVKEEYYDVTLRYSGEDFSYSELVVDDLGGSTRLEDLSLILSKHQPRDLGRLRLDEVLSLEYLLERYDLLELLFTPEEREYIDDYITPDEKNVLNPNFHALIPGVAWIYTHADNRTYSLRGLQVRLGLRGTSELLGSNISFWQAHGGALGIRALGDTGGRLILRGAAGYTEADTVESLDANVLPHAVQFRTGGDRSVRGYAFEELEGGLTGGKHLLVGSVEYEQRLYDKWGAAVFFDIGNSFNSFANYGLKEGAGVGLRWHSPVGLVRVDVAAALSEDGDPWRVHINIGPDF